MNDNNSTVTFIVFEATCTRFDCIIKRLAIALVVCILLMFASNAIWLYAWMQYDYTSEATTTETVTVDGNNGIANYADRGGRVTNGTSESYEDYNEEADTEEEELKGD